MVGVPVQTGTSLGRQLVFFLFLLVPGYLAVRAYYWANIALENDARVNRLVLMAIGGFVSLAIVALWRQLVPTIRFAPLAFLTPEWLVVDGVLRVQTISRLSVLESVNLIVSQGIVAVVGGYVLGTAKYVWYDERNQTHSNLEHPWTQLTDEISNEPIIVVSNDGTHTKGRPAALGSEEQDHDIMLVASGPEEDTETTDSASGSDDDTEATDLSSGTSTDDSLPRGTISYHPYDDISRVVVPETEEDMTNRPLLQRKHAIFVEGFTEDLDFIQKICYSFISRIKSAPYRLHDCISGDGDDSDDQAPEITRSSSDDE